MSGNCIRISVLLAAFLLPTHAFGQTAKAHRSASTGTELCEKVSAGAATVGATVASASTLAGTAGVAAVAHSSGAAILTSVGAGGTRYLAGTLGGAGATALGLISAPVVIAGAATVAVAGAGGWAYCHLKR